MTQRDPAQRMSGAMRYHNPHYRTRVADDLDGDTEHKPPVHWQ